MIGTSVDTRTFSEIGTEERFRAEPPRSSSLLMNDAIDVTQSEKGTEVNVAELGVDIDLPSVEQTLDEMVEKCRTAVEKYPKSPRSHMNLGLALLRRGYTAQGIASLQQAVSLDNNDYIAVSSLAAAHFNGGDLEIAKSLYDQMAVNFAGSVAGHMGLASIALRRNNLQEVSSHLERALSIDSNLANASFLLAIVQFKLNKPQKAISVLRKALKDNVRSPELNQGLAIAYLLAGDQSRAEKSFQTALSLNPKLSSALHGLAVLWLRQNKSDEVIQILSRHLEHDPNDMEGREMLAQAFVLKEQYRQARNHLNIILTTLSSLPVQDKNQIAKIANNIGFCFASEGNYKEAETKILEAIHELPIPSAEAVENLARVYFAQGKTERALESIDASISKGLRSSSLVLLKEACLINLGRYEDAIIEMLRLVAEKNAPMESYAELGWLLCDWREDYQTALAVLKTGLDKWSDSALIINNLAYVHLMNGELAAAHALLEVIRDDGKNAVFITATKGLLALHQGEIPKGEALYRQAEDLASEAGNRPLMLAVRQKKCLEIARALIKMGEFDRASRFIEQGQSISLTEKRYPFAQQLAAFKSSVTKTLNLGHE
jgi:tetratricopeptide (TPR) repeat protein